MTPPNQPFRTELIHRTCTKEMLLQPAELCNVSLFVCDCLRLLLRSSFNHHNCSAVWEEGHTFADFYLCKEIWILNYRPCGFFFFPDACHSQLLGCTASSAPGCSAPVSLGDPGVWASWPACVWSHPLCASSGCQSLGPRKRRDPMTSLESNTYEYNWIRTPLYKIKTND